MKTILSAWCVYPLTLSLLQASVIQITGGLDSRTTGTVNAVVSTNDATNPGAHGWRVWADTTDLSGSDFKSGTNSVGSISLIGLVPGEVSVNDTGMFDYAWVDGTHVSVNTLSGTDGFISDSVAGNSAGDGYEVPVTLSGMEGRITLYAGVRRTEARAVLFDEDDDIVYDSNLVNENVDASTVGSQTYAGIYTFNYSDAVIGEVLRIQWIDVSDDSNSQLRLGGIAETATVIPEHASALLFLFGFSLFWFLCRHRT